jgi:hypothetical protein
LICSVLSKNLELWKILPFVAFAYPDRNRGCSDPKSPADGASDAN